MLCRERLRVPCGSGRQLCQLTSGPCALRSSIRRGVRCVPPPVPSQDSARSISGLPCFSAFVFAVCFLSCQVSFVSEAGRVRCTRPFELAFVAKFTEGGGGQTSSRSSSSLASLLRRLCLLELPTRRVERLWASSRSVLYGSVGCVVYVPPQNLSPGAPSHEARELLPWRLALLRSLRTLFVFLGPTAWFL